ncbi:hypothetical protein [Marinobacterium lutimaris]|uniref:Uncharacterized protein n=1 Tax=Marinobacterium lutimaris TaxID=568106 RepID=A0A1H6AYM7_9GAMM|nr:hypothetical protein [Marinobacterium lutimaris]SEG53145.1 hypothetical protein SAMN05444390_102269 [Marinobacterium lutimaris]
MSERKEPGLDLQGLESDEPVRKPAAAPERQAPRPAKAAKPENGRGGGFLLTLILLLLAGGVAGLGYWTLEMKKTLDAQQAELEKTRERLAEVSETLALNSDSASEAGQTLMGRIGELEGQASEKYEHFDSEIAKLWTVAYQRNKPQLEEQQKALDAQGKAVESLQQTLADTEKKVAAVEGTQQELASVKKSLASLESSLDQQKSRIESVSSDASFALSLEKDERTAAQQSMQGKVQSLQQKLDSQPDLSRKISSIEQSIQAIDGSRRQFNQSLLQLRDQLNQLQRRVEGG